MILKKLSRIFILIFLFVSVVSCNKDNTPREIVNTSHLDYLYEEISVNNTEMAIIHIYSNYPSYKYVDDEDEGTACVDDAARAAIFYLENYKIDSTAEPLQKNKKLLEFVIYMQAENGYFYNFIWSDYTINKDFKTSVAEPNWWTWRALWALTESYPYYLESDKIFSEKIKLSVEKIITAIKKEIPVKYDTENFNGFEIPAYLPNKYASDQASVLLLGLINYYKQTNNETIYNYMKLLSKGIMQMQIAGKENNYYGAFLSWQNIWHAYGNIQSYALLKSYQVLNDELILDAVLKELNNFYPVLLKNKYLSSFVVEKKNQNIIIKSENKYSQIAYNIRPMVYALIEAYQITNDEKYAEIAGKIGRWFTGDNPTKTKIYNEETGIVFDGIESSEKVNMNSGAESTIEALLSIIIIKNNKVAEKVFNIE